jgi:RNA polymerase sigma factor (sigma-70 family)
MKFAMQVDEESLRRDMKKIAAISNERISRRERERLFVRTAILHLPSNCRLILFLKFWEGETLREIAETVGFSVESVRASYLLALAYLEHDLRPYVLESEFFLRGEPAIA